MRITKCSKIPFLTLRMRWEKRRQAFGRIKEWTKHTSWSKVTLFRCNSLSVAWEFKRWWEGRYLSTRTAETIRFVRYNSSGSPTSKLDKWTKKNQSDVTSIMTPQRNKEATDYPPLNKQKIYTIFISITITYLSFFSLFLFPQSIFSSTIRRETLRPSTPSLPSRQWRWYEAWTPLPENYRRCDRALCALIRKP